MCIGKQGINIEAMRLYQSGEVLCIKVAAAEKGAKKGNGVHRGRVKK